MNVRLIAIITLPIIILLAIAFLLTWHVFGGETKVRTALLDSFSAKIGKPIDAERLSLSLRKISFENVDLELSPSLSLHVDQIHISLSPITILLNGLKNPGVIGEVELVTPRFNLTPSVSDTSKTTGFEYRPYPLKSLSNIDIIRRITIKDAVVSFGQTSQILVDSLSGRIDLADISNGNLSLGGRFRRMSGTHLDLNGSFNLIEGSFLISIQAMIENLGSWQPPRELQELHLNKGSLLIQVELRGTEDLMLSGDVQADSIDVSYGDLIQLTNGSFSGEIFGSGFNLNGEFNLNGLLLPFSVSIPDLLDPKWFVEIDQAEVDLGNLSVSRRLKLPSMDGSVEINASISSREGCVDGQLALTGSEIIIDPVCLEKIVVRVAIDSNRLSIDEFNADLLGGELRLGGTIDPYVDSSIVDVSYRRRWSSDRKPWMLQLQSPEFRMEGVLILREGDWEGYGGFQLEDGEGSEQLSGEFKLLEPNFSLNITSTGHGGSLSLTANSIGDTLIYNINSQDPHRFLRGIITEKYLPEFLDLYSIKVHIDGDRSRLNSNMFWNAVSGERNLYYQGVVTRDGKGYKSHADLKLKTVGGSTFRVNVSTAYNRDKLYVGEIRLIDGAGKSLLQTHFNYSFIDSSFSNLEFQADSLPMFELFHFFKPDEAVGFDGHLTSTVAGDSDSLQWSGKLEIIYPDSIILNLETSGIYNDGLFRFDGTELLDNQGDVRLFSVEGGIDLKAKLFDSLVVRLNDLPIDRILELVWQEKADRFGGRLNALMEADGLLDHPELYADLHLTGGILHEIPGYWLNLRFTTEDSLYNLENLDFGRDIIGLVNVNGKMNRYDHLFDFDMSGEDIEIGTLFEMIMGKSGLLSGNCDFKMHFAGKGKVHQVEADISVSPGRVGALTFDNLNTHFNVSGFDNDQPVVLLDSLTIDWNDAWGKFSGVVPLKKDREIDVNGSIQGNLPTLLPRMTSYCSRPKGQGELYLELGGDIESPRLTSGYLDIRDGSIRLKSIVEKIDEFNARIELDENGNISIVRFDVLGNGRPVFIGNRMPLTGEEALVYKGYNLGIFQFVTDREGIWTVIPALMQPDWGGYVRISGMNKKGSFEIHGPVEKPLGTGEIRLMNATVTYPFIKSGKQRSRFTRGLLNLLRRMRWDGRVIPYQGCGYSRELSGFGGAKGFSYIDDQLAGGLLDVDIKMFVDLMIDDNPEGLHITGSFEDTLQIRGELTSTKGKVEYLDLEFDVEKIGVIFNPVELEPFFYGGVRTDVIDSVGIPHEIRWVIRGTGQTSGLDATVPSVTVGMDRGRWREIALVYEDDQGHSQEQILAMLGYSPEAIPEKLVSLGSKLVSDVTPIRRWTRTFERYAERWLGVDRIDIESPLARNIIERQLFLGRSSEEIHLNYSYLQTLDHSRVTVGKYLARGIYVSYTGSVLSSTDAYDVTRLGVIHNWDILFRLHQIAPDLTVNYRYEYDSKLKEADNRVMLRFSYTFK
ncbi:translocation/assembly module TamB domain-containing protein [bacterium]|nr:translocation/assembly module TamB domain-containing protein [bacterium]